MGHVWATSDNIPAAIREIERQAAAIPADVILGLRISPYTNMQLTHFVAYGTAVRFG